MPPPKKPVRRKKAAPASVGLTAAETLKVASADVDRLKALVEEDGGVVLGAYNDPFGGLPLLLVALPVDRVEPTPYQRDPSGAHVKRLPAWVYDLPESQRLSLVAGYLDTDGCAAAGRRGFSIKSVNKPLLAEIGRRTATIGCRHSRGSASAP